MAERQGAILQAQAARVRPGGTLVYATCSLSRAENGAQPAERAGELELRVPTI